MGKPITHAISAARRFGGNPEDYLEIHEFMDSSKQGLSDNRHRAMTHNSWFIYNILPRVFGTTITNAQGTSIPVTSIGEQHVLEDYGGRFIPTMQDWLQGIPYEDWMNNGSGGSAPPSIAQINSNKVRSND